MTQLARIAEDHYHDCLQGYLRPHPRVHTYSVHRMASARVTEVRLYGDGRAPLAAVYFYDGLDAVDVVMLDPILAAVQDLADGDDEIPEACRWH